MTDEHLDFQPRMSDADKLMWTIERDPLLRSTITSVVVLDGPPDHARLKDKVERASRTVIRLRQRVIGNALSFSPPRWEVDPNFDLDYHLRFVKAANDGSMRELFDIAEPIGMQAFDRARPLWEFTVVEGLEEGRAGLIMKIHHAVTDGVGGVKLLLETFDAEPDPGEPGDLPEAPAVHVMGQAERLADAVAHEQRRVMGVAKRSFGTLSTAALVTVADPVGAGARVSETVASALRLLAPASEPLSPLMTERSLSVQFHTLTVPLAEMKIAGRRAGGKLNDAFVAAIASGWRRYHDHHGKPAGALRMSMPISVRTAATENVAGNQFAPARFPVPLTVVDPVHRMKVVRDLVGRARGEPALALTEPLANLLNHLPPDVTTGIFGSMLRGVDFVTSNVPGPPFPIYLSGARVISQFPFGPMAGAAANITLLSYVDDLNIGINTDPSAVPDPETLVECMQEGFDEILKC
ncbi:MAG: wax ester/triacylglycerol synthase family O-acyltransferase [Acidimicrobiales bacterium]